jgi:hypothetical protein
VDENDEEETEEVNWLDEETFKAVRYGGDNLEDDEVKVELRRGVGRLRDALLELGFTRICEHRMVLRALE